MEFEFARADANNMPITNSRLLNLLTVDLRTVAAAIVANSPAIVLEGDDRMHPRTHRIGHRDVAVCAASQQGLATRIEREIRPRPGTGKNSQISIIQRQTTAPISNIALNLSHDDTPTYQPLGTTGTRQSELPGEQQSQELCNSSPMLGFQAMSWADGYF